MCEYKLTEEVRACSQTECVHALKGLELLQASHYGEIALAGSHRLRSALVGAPVLFAHTAVAVFKNK